MAAASPVARATQGAGVHERRYRLINSCCEPHPQLDGDYPSLDEAMSDAVDWLLSSDGLTQQQPIGVEVCTANGDWRTYRLPAPLVCALPASTGLKATRALPLTPPDAS